MKKYNNITEEDFKSVLLDRSKQIYGDNISLGMKCVKNNPYEMTKFIQHKVILNSKHNKMRLPKNDSCAPFIENQSREDFIIDKAFENLENFQTDQI
jgi:hypothetical protein